MVKYSIIIPVFNGEEYIEECIQSVIIQNRSDVEIIVVNDGSTDRTQDICRGFGEKIKLINKNNSGSMDSWIIGVKAAMGDYICFLDADDLIEKNYFNTIDSYVEKNDIVMFDFYRMYKNISIPEKVNSIQYGKVSSLELNLLKSNYYANYSKYSFYRWDKVVKASIIKENIQNIQCRAVYFEDLIIGLLNLQKATSVFYLDKKLYYYRMRAKSVSHGFNWRIFSDNILVEKESMRIARENHFSNVAKEKMHVYFLFHYTRWSMKSKIKPERIKVTIADVKCIDGLTKKMTLLFYKFRLDWLFNRINTIMHCRNKKDYVYF